jgi:hypothetical protein
MDVLYPENKRRELGILEESDEEYNKYLSSLTSYSLDRLTKEPDMLKHEAIKIRQQMEELAFKNYKAFILTSDCVRTTHREVNLWSFAQY